MESVDVVSEMDEILKEAQETNPEGEDTADTVAPTIPNSSSSGDSPITLLRQLLHSKKLW